MGKVLISLVGVGSSQKAREYKKALYRYDGQEMETSFIALALTKFLQPERIFLLGTKEAMWEEVYKQFCDFYPDVKIDEDIYLGLMDMKNASLTREGGNYSEDNLIRTVEKSMGGDSRIFFLEKGIDGAEREKNFETLLEMADQLKDNDEVYLDFTHSFRSHGFFLQTSISYITDIISQNITIKGIFYGMFEESGELGYTPIINMMDTYEMMQLIKAAHEFKETGKGYLLADMMLANKKMANQLVYFSNSMGLNYPFEIPRIIEKIRLEIEEDVSLTKSKKILLEKVISEFEKRFGKKNNDEIDMNIKFAEWMMDKKQYGYAYIILKETILSIVCADMRWECSSKQDKAIEDNRKKAGDLLKEKKYNKLYKVYKAVNTIRITTSHFTKERSLDRHLNDVQNISHYIQTVKMEYKNILGEGK